MYIDKILSKFYLAQTNISNTPIKESPLIANKKKAMAAK